MPKQCNIVRHSIIFRCTTNQKFFTLTSFQMHKKDAETKRTRKGRERESRRRGRGRHGLEEWCDLSCKKVVVFEPENAF